jgi:putative acetyltransferase
MSTISSPAVCLRPEQPADVHKIREINEAAFQGRAEADLVDALRGAGMITLSAVALLGCSPEGEEKGDATHRSGMCTDEVVGGELVGHILFTPVTVTTEKADVPLLGLGPVAVLPARQHQGVGTLMVSGCLEHLRAQRHRGVVVVGEPAFYRRFGFIKASRWGLQWETEVPEENFMALELTPGFLAGVSGVVRYRPEFSKT